MDGPAVLSLPPIPNQKPVAAPQTQSHSKPNQVGTVSLYGIHIVSLVIEGQERLCLAQISNTLLKQFSYNEIHNRRVALGITCVQCTPVQLEILRRAGAMPVSSRRCGMITRREAERLCKSFLGDNAPPRLPDDFAFSVHHECGWGCRGAFLPARYNSSRAKCIKCAYCGLFFSPNKFIFHSHRVGPANKYVEPDAANFNSWRRHMKLSGSPPDDVVHAWEDVKAMFNGGTRKRLLSNPSGSRSTPTTAAKQARLSPSNQLQPPPPPPPPPPIPAPTHPRVPPFPELPLLLSRSFVMDHVWHQHQQAAAAAAVKTPGFAFPPYAWLAKHRPSLFPGPLPPPLIPGATTPENLMPSMPSPLHQSAFRPVIRGPPLVEPRVHGSPPHGSSVDKDENSDDDDDDEVDIETTEEEEAAAAAVAAAAAAAANAPLNSSSLHSLNSASNSALSTHSGHSGHSGNSGHSGHSTSPQCWSPPRETEREAEKIAEETAALRDVKAEVPSATAAGSPESWQHGGTMYRHLHLLRGSDVSECTACRPRGLFYSQVHSPSASTN